MWWRTLFAAAVVTCTVTLAQGPQPLNQIKDVLCVMLLNSIQKEDLTAITRRLQSENISENNTLPSDIRRIIDLTTNKTDITKRNDIKDNEGMYNSHADHSSRLRPTVASDVRMDKQNFSQIGHSSDRLLCFQPGACVRGSHDALFESKERRENNRTDLNQPTESNLNYKRIENKIVENNLQDDEETNCDVVLDYKNGQPTLLSLFHFWRNCVNTSRPIENNDKEIIFRNNSASVQNKSNSNARQQNIVPTLHVDAEQTMKQTRTDIKRRYDEDATAENQVASKIKPKVQFLQNVYETYLSSRRNSEESFKSKADTKFNNLNDDSSVEYTISYNESHATNNLVTKILSAPKNEPVSLIYSTEIAKESRSDDNNLYYGKFEEHDNLNSKDFYNIEEPPKVYKSGYGKIFYEYNETNGNSFKENPYQFIEMIKSLAKKPINSFLHSNQLDGKKSELDIKLQEVLRLLEKTTVNKVNLDNNNIPITDSVRRQFNTNNQTPTENVDLMDIDSIESTKRYFKMLSRTNIPVVSVPNVHYANYLPPGNRTINTSNTKYKFTQQRVTMLNNGETAYSNIPKYIYFYPKNIPLKTVVDVNNKRIHSYYKDAVGRTYQSNLFEPIKEIKSTSLEVVSVSSIHYVNYLHPEKSIINSVSASKETDKISKLVPQFSKSYIYSREADEHNYYEYEKVNIIAGNHNSHNFKSYYFYPEISQKLRTEPRLPGIHFTPNVPERGNGQIKEDAYASETQKQNNVLENITKNVDAVYSRDGNMHNVNLDNAANLDKKYTVETVPCTQKYANATDRRINLDMKMNEPVIIDENKVLPKNVITNIAESIKTAILGDLRKELNIAPSTSTTTMRSLSFKITTRGTPSVKIAETTTQIETTQKIITQETVLEKIMKYLEQMNTSKNGPQNRVNNFQFSNRNVKILDKENQNLTTETYLRALNEQKNYDITNRNYKLAVQRHKKKATVHKDIQRQKKYKVKDKIVEPKTFQTNELQIAPLGVYVDSFVSPINQNIIVSPHNKNTGHRNKNVIYYKALERKEIQNNLPPPKYRTNIPPPTNYVRTSQQYNINSYTNYDYQNNHMSKEHKDVKYLDDKFLNNVVKYSTAPKLPSNKDCCDREYLSQLMYECCNDKVVSRSVEPLVNNEANDGYRSFIQSQNKVNVMLAKALASRSKFRSVESI